MNDQPFAYIFHHTATTRFDSDDEIVSVFHADIEEYKPFTADEMEAFRPKGALCCFTEDNHAVFNTFGVIETASGPRKAFTQHEFILKETLTADELRARDLAASF